MVLTHSLAVKLLKQLCLAQRAHSNLLESRKQKVKGKWGLLTAEFGQSTNFIHLPLLPSISLRWIFTFINFHYSFLEENVKFSVFT